MHIDEAIADIESCTSVQHLTDTLHRLVQSFGFSGFGFIDAGTPYLDEPFYVGTPGRAWEQEYRGNNFVHVDPCLAKVRRTNIPF